MLMKNILLLPLVISNKNYEGKEKIKNVSTKKILIGYFSKHQKNISLIFSNFRVMLKSYLINLKTGI
jgi:hypothetical protein